MRDGMRPGSRKMASLFVCLREWLRPSSPRVSYAVTKVMDWDAAPVHVSFILIQYSGILTMSHS